MEFPPPVFPTQRQGFAETFLENGVLWAPLGSLFGVFLGPRAGRNRRSSFFGLLRRFWLSRGGSLGAFWVRLGRLSAVLVVLVVGVCRSFGFVGVCRFLLPAAMPALSSARE